jgi:cytochrome c oxidase subunit 2
MREAWRRPARYGWPLGLLLAALVLSGCGAGNMPAGGTPEGREIHRLWTILLIAGGIIFFAVEALIVWTIVRYRRRDDLLPKQTHGNNLLEIVWTVIPLMIVGGLFAVSYGGIAMVDREVPQPDRTIEVVGFQWQWNFTYIGEQLPVKSGQEADVLTLEGTIAKPPELVLPLGERIRFNLKSADVIHSFYVPGWNFKRDVVPYPQQPASQAAEEEGATQTGSQNQETGEGAAPPGQSPEEEGVDKFNSFEVTVDRLGTFPGQCAEYCGLQHSAMHFTVKVVPRAEFDAWLAEAKKQAASGCPSDAGRQAVPDHVRRQGPGQQPAQRRHLRRQGRDRAERVPRCDRRGASDQLRRARARPRGVLLPLRRAPASDEGKARCPVT